MSLRPDCFNDHLYYRLWYTKLYYGWYIACDWSMRPTVYTHTANVVTQFVMNLCTYCYQLTEIDVDFIYFQMILSKHLKHTAIRVSPQYFKPLKCGLLFGLGAPTIVGS